jgi:hypothetical protein
VRISGNYETLDDIKRREEKVSKEKWVGGKNFMNVLGKQLDPHYIKNYVVKDPSQNPTLHKFREESKESWISGAFLI